MKKRIIILINRIKTIYKTEGVVSLMRRGFNHLGLSLFSYGTLYLNRRPLVEENEAEVVPSIQNFTLKMISSNQQADELVANGFEDFRHHISNSKRRLDSGAIAFCLFVGKEFASISWVAMDEKAQRSLVSLPMRINFSEEALLEDIMTIPKYRRKGLHSYIRFKRNQFLEEQGITTRITTVRASNNIRLRRMSRRAGSQYYAKAKYIKFVWWTWWKETPIAPNSTTVPYKISSYRRT